MKYFPWIAIAFVAAAVIGAFFLVGSPANQRLARFDERRLNDLQSIRFQIARYFAAKDKLPATLADIKGLDDFVVPVDPESGASYEYVVKAPMQFQLCANFALASDKTGQSDASPFAKPLMPEPGGDTRWESWQHPAGRGCFDVTLEKPVSDSQYPVVPSITVKPAV